MKTVSIIGTVGVPANYGGFESLVENLTKHSSKEIIYTVYCSSLHYKAKLSTYNNARLIYLPIKANGIQSIFYDILSMIVCLYKRTDVILVLGVSGCLFLPFFKLFSRSKIVTNIDGLEWRREKWGRLARFVLKASEACAIKYSDCIITDNQAISDYVNDSYNKESTVIAYGGDHAIRKNIVCITKKNYFLALCRIEPENNVSMILEAFNKNGKPLKFIGNWNASEYGISLKKKYKNSSNIEIIDPIYDIDTLYTYRAECMGYIHGHSAGGTNPSLVEAMHFGIPIFAYDCDFNKYSTENSAFYFSSADSLNSLLESIHSDILEISASKMKLIASERYTWSAINKLYECCYNSEV